MGTITVKIRYPEWAAVEVINGVQFLVIDPQVVYPMVLGLLKQEPDRYWLEVARRCLTTALRDMVGAGINVRILNRPEWALAAHPEGEGEARGSSDFRRHYDCIKGALRE